MHTAVAEIDRVPAQRYNLGSAQPVTIGDQHHSRITVAVAAPRYRDENYVPRYGPDQYGAWSGGATQRFDARGYDRLYNSYGEPRFGPDARYPGRSRVNPRSPETLYPTQTGRPRREQYWGGYRYGD